MLCVCKVYSTSALRLLLTGEEHPITAQDILPTQPNPSGVHHSPQVLLIHTLILLYICKFK